MTNKQASADPDRRALFLGLSSMTALGVAACATSGASLESPKAQNGGEDAEGGEHAEVTPGEDLMQEHGVLDRILLVYDEAVVRLGAGQSLDPSLIAGSAAIVRRFVEDYHEQLEETFVFPRLVKAGRQLDLVAVLKEQHKRGRSLTDDILATARAEGRLDAARLGGLLGSFVRMYRPHASREETVLFPAFRATLDADGYRELGETFEHREHELFGEGGFEEVVAQIAKVEVALEIHDLARFTPR